MNNVFNWIFAILSILLLSVIFYYIYRIQNIVDIILKYLNEDSLVTLLKNPKRVILRGSHSLVFTPHIAPESLYILRELKEKLLQKNDKKNDNINQEELREIIENEYRKIFSAEYQTKFVSEKQKIEVDYSQRLSEEQRKIEEQYKKKLFDERKTIEKAYQRKIDEEKQKRLEAEAAAREAQEVATKGQNRRRNDSRSAFFQNPTRAAAFQILGLQYEASQTEIKASYRKLSNLFHPDKYAGLGTERQTEAAEEMKAINLAHDILTKQR